MSVLKVAWAIYESFRQNPSFFCAFQSSPVNCSFMANMKFVPSKNCTFMSSSVEAHCRKKRIFFILFGFRPNGKSKTTERKKGDTTATTTCPRLMDYSSGESCICHPLLEWDGRYHPWKKRIKRPSIPRQATYFFPGWISATKVKVYP